MLVSCGFNGGVEGRIEGEVARIPGAVVTKAEEGMERGGELDLCVVGCF